MKIKILSVIFFLSLFLYQPISASALVMEVNFTISNLNIPERAALLTAENYPDTEFAFIEGRVIAMVGSSVKATKQFATNIIRQGESLIISFPYVSGTDYDLRLEVRGSNQGNNILCTARCGVIPVGSNQCFTSNSVAFKTTLSSASCPSTSCAGTNFRDRFSFTGPCYGYSDANGTESGTSYYFWRSPTLITIQ